MVAKAIEGCGVHAGPGLVFKQYVISIGGESETQTLCQICRTTMIGLGYSVVEVSSGMPTHRLQPVDEERVIRDGTPTG